MKTTAELDINKVFLAENARRFNEEQLQRLQVSIEKIGLKTPITVMPVMKIWCGQNTECYEIVAGGHRWEACGRLGHQTIEAYIENDKDAAKLWEISENLDRAELTVTERAELLTKWVELCRADKPVQNGQVRDVGGRGCRSGISDASRQLGIPRSNVGRAVKIATKLTPEAKAEAQRLGLDNNERALIEAAAKPPQEQAEYLKRRNANKHHLPDDDENLASATKPERTVAIVKSIAGTIANRIEREVREYPKISYTKNEVEHLKQLIFSAIGIHLDALLDIEENQGQ